MTKMNKPINLFFLFLLSVSLTVAQPTSTGLPEFTGPYLGQKPPGKIPELFAPNLMTAEMGYHSTIVFSPGLDEALWRPMDNNGGKILYSKMKEGKWTKPEWVNFGINERILDPVFSVDGNKIYFLSFKPDADGKNKRERIWFVNRTLQGWSEPKLIDKAVYDHPTHWTFSIAKNGNIYFTSECNEAKGEQDIYVAQFDGEKYLPPLNLGPAVNSDDRDFCPFIAPDESYLIFTRFNKNTGKGDLFISYKNHTGEWAKAISLGTTINSTAFENSPYVTPDGKYLFFISQKEITNGMYWVSAKIIEDLKPKN